MTEGRAFLVQDVTYYSKAALYDAFKAWRDGGPACSGRFDDEGHLETQADDADDALRPGRQEDDRRRSGPSTPGSSRATSGACSGSPTTLSPKGLFPQYYKHVGDERVAVPAEDVPAETQAARPGVQAGRAGSALHLADRAAPGPSPARKRVRSRSSSSTVRW
ncbi:MAG: hypothetical protein M0C28_39825 [Candidatus Moduliflexus flocculans]|nr:hypothetical protein [Candidatus Moduliflexus flocculans]